MRACPRQVRYQISYCRLPSFLSSKFLIAARPKLPMKLANMSQCILDFSARNSLVDHRCSSADADVIPLWSQFYRDKSRMTFLLTVFLVV